MSYQISATLDGAEKRDSRLFEEKELEKQREELVRDVLQQAQQAVGELYGPREARTRLKQNVAGSRARLRSKFETTLLPTHLLVSFYSTSAVRTGLQLL